MYDFFVKTYDVTTTVDKPVEVPDIRLYSTETALIVYAGDIVAIQLYSMNGSMVSRSVYSQLVSTAGLDKGIYLVEIVKSDGNRLLKKFIKK